MMRLRNLLMDSRTKGGVKRKVVQSGLNGALEALGQRYAASCLYCKRTGTAKLLTLRIVMTMRMCAVLTPKRATCSDAS